MDVRSSQGSESPGPGTAWVRDPVSPSGCLASGGDIQEWEHKKGTRCQGSQRKAGEASLFAHESEMPVNNSEVGRCPHLELREEEEEKGNYPRTQANEGLLVT